jgi:hypothetical protein
MTPYHNIVVLKDRKPKLGGTLMLLLLVLTTATMMTDKTFQSYVLEFFFTAVCESAV